MSTPDSYPKARTSAQAPSRQLFAKQQQHTQPTGLLLVLLQVSQLVIQGVHALSNPNAGVVAVCPSAQHLVATAANSFAVVYDTSTPAAPVQVQQLRSTTSNQALQCVAWSCCGTHLAAGEGGSNASVFIWDVSGGRCVHELKAHKTTIARLCFSPDGRWRAVAVCLQMCPV